MSVLRLKLMARTRLLEASRAPEDTKQNGMAVEYHARHDAASSVPDSRAPDSQERVILRHHPWKTLRLRLRSRTEQVL